MELYHIYMCVLFLFPIYIRAPSRRRTQKRGHLPRMPTNRSDWEGPGRARHWAPQVGSESRLSMVDTSVLDARKHGPAFAHSITTELRLTCEAPSAKRLRTAGSSETSFALIVRPDKSQGFLYSQKVRERLKEKPLASTRANSHHQHVCQCPCRNYPALITTYYIPLENTS